MKLHFGVADFPYRYEQEAVGKSGKVLKKRKIVASSTTTGEVAQKLEEDYKLFDKFYEMNEQFISDALSNSVLQGLEAILTGAPMGSYNVFGQAAADIEARFKEAITSQEFDYQIAGVPTQASLDGVNHRLAHPYAQSNPRRPSFRDTGMFESSIKVWTE